jgi:hypothetical protein
MTIIKKAAGLAVSPETLTVSCANAARVKLGGRRTPRASPRTDRIAST